MFFIETMKVSILVTLLTICVALAAVPSKTSVLGPKSSTSVCLPSNTWDFIILLPVDKILCIIEEHLKSDAAFCKVVFILQSDEFRYFLQAIKCNEPITKLIAYIQDAGMSDKDFIIEKVIRNIIIPDAKCTYQGTGESSLGPLLEDIRAVLPYYDLIELFNNKLENNTAFKELIEKLKYKEFYEIVSEVLFLEEVQELLWTLRYWDVAIDDLLTTICNFLWWEPCYIYDPLSHRSSSVVKLLKLDV